ncbi:MAG: glycosyltransferase family 1 protein [Candidatus Jettenia sp.]|uniref:Putative glycosyltransferase n=1 Tax=Candidatus Jettenia caeni TaxID=247490 RepID=I3IJY7_9BACT|nr:glycosyltransferase family 4 protein [Candidatus Jettenia sp. AMX1]MBC6930649.1 glycosyltransferase family 1 protein [Candidatus Jettenia sp.]NUN24765.1 glycosyltransferase family 4 protein [Candidatus Jettenia caeni]KAA0246407.1 MAG: glycosyltransferase family 1 protein [Candidatus Jettenia sp. AMX1]MCE7879433.1 glycosyltransferase family 1 protein [Candidatus Jettenia sp. AMX1]MDL1940679.1 glycosyltransferase family 4 protein [Candidatus Jettenia sp. AMX1]
MEKKALFIANTGFALFNYRLQLMKFLSNQGWSVVAIANDEADYVNKFSNIGIRFININIDHKGKNPIADVALIWRLKSLYNQESPSLVHHFTIKPVIFGSLAAKWAKVPAIINSITGLGYVFNERGLLMRTSMMLYKFALSGRPRVIFQNNDDYQLFVSNALIKKTNAQVILGSGVNTKVFYPNTIKRSDANLQFLLVSRMLWSKGISEYISAAERVKKQYPETKFILAGGASGGGAKGNPDAIPEKWLNEVNARGIAKWIGRIPFEDVMILLDNSDVVVLPSYYPEGVPRSLIEAAAKGKPIITTNTPGCKEVVVDGVNGFFSSPKDVESLANCMLKFIREPELINKMGIESRKRAVDIFDEEKILEKTAGVYKKAGAL